MQITGETSVDAQPESASTRAPNQRKKVREYAGTRTIQLPASRPGADEAGWAFRGTVVQGVTPRTPTGAHPQVPRTSLHRVRTTCI